jgi:DNA-binding NarL/FixJ family response regulator
LLQRNVRQVPPSAAKVLLMIRLVVCDDHDMVRTAMVRILELDGQYQVVGQSASARQLLDLMTPSAAAGAGMEFDVLLLDLNLGMPGLMNGMELIKILLATRPGMQIVVVSMHEDPDTVNAALMAGALGYVSKSSSIEVLQEAVHHASQARRFLDPNLVEAVVALKQERRAGNRLDVDLTKREREVMVLLCQGHRVGAIAQSLNLSIKTASTHKIRLMEKLNVSNLADLFKLGQQYGLK